MMTLKKKGHIKIVFQFAYGLEQMYNFFFLLIILT